MNPTYHPLSSTDEQSIAAMRAALAGNRLDFQDPQTPALFDQIMEAVALPVGITYEPARMGGVDGWWCHPAAPKPGAAILYLHGGAFVVGSARAYRHFAGQFAGRTRASTFVPDYRLAPTHRFPAALDDVMATYAGLVDGGAKSIAVVGDSAGGGLALTLLALATARAKQGGLLPCGAAVLSPWTDLAMSGASLQTRASVDFLVSEKAAAPAARDYLGAHDARDPLASPLYGDLAGLPPICIQVGEDEVLLDDALRYGERAHEQGVAVTVDVWAGMPHVFLSNVGNLAAADEAVAAVAKFLTGRLETGHLAANG